MNKPRQSQGSSGQNQGEGNREADRQYRKGATASAESRQNREKAREAEQAVDSEERAELERAERAGKAKARD